MKGIAKDSLSPTLSVVSRGQTWPRETTLSGALRIRNRNHLDLHLSGASCSVAVLVASRRSHSLRAGYRWLVTASRPKKPSFYVREPKERGWILRAPLLPNWTNTISSHSKLIIVQYLQAPKDIYNNYYCSLLYDHFLPEMSIS